MLDDNQTDQFRAAIIDRFSVEELCEFLCLNTEDIVDRFFEEIVAVDPLDWGEYL